MAGKARVCVGHSLSFSRLDSGERCSVVSTYGSGLVRLPEKAIRPAPHLHLNVPATWLTLERMPSPRT